MENNENLSTESPSGASTELPAGTSEAPEQAAAAAASAAPAVKADEPKSALEAALKVIGDRRTEAESTAHAQQQAQQSAEAPAGQDKAPPIGKEGDDDFIPPAEYHKLDGRVKRRIGKLTEQAKMAREAVKKYEPAARYVSELQSFCETSGIAQEEFTWTLQFMRNAKQNPAAAYEMIQPVLEQLRAYVGDEVFPEDIAKRIEGGTLSKEDARELVLARNERARLERQTQETTIAQRQEAQQRQIREHIGGVQGALAELEGRWKSSDADYPKKMGQIWAQMQMLIENQITQRLPAYGGDRSLAKASFSSTEMLALAEQAKKNVDGWIAGLMPPAREMRPVIGGGANTVTNKQPGSALEAARMGLQRARQAA